MRKEDGNSAQCAWLFSHAHLIGKPCIQIKDGERFHLRNLAFDLSSVFTVFAFALPVVVAFAFLALAFSFFIAMFCCFSRSARSSSSWCGLSTSMQGSAYGQTMARPLIPTR